MVFDKLKKFHIFRYIIYDFLKKVSGGNRPTCLVRVHCALLMNILVSMLHGAERQGGPLACRELGPCREPLQIGA